LINPCHNDEVWFQRTGSQHRENVAGIRVDDGKQSSRPVDACLYQRLFGGGIAMQNRITHFCGLRHFIEVAVNDDKRLVLLNQLVADMLSHPAETADDIVVLKLF